MVRMGCCVKMYWIGLSGGVELGVLPLKVTPDFGEIWHLNTYYCCVECKTLMHGRCSGMIGSVQKVEGVFQGNRCVNCDDEAVEGTV